MSNKDLIEALEKKRDFLIKCADSLNTTIEILKKEDELEKLRISLQHTAI